MTLNLTKPNEGDVGWGAGVRQNFIDIESAVNQGGFTDNQFVRFPEHFALGNLVNLTAVSSRPLFTPFEVGRAVTWNAARIEVSRATTANNAFTLHSGLYTIVNSTQISLAASSSWAFSHTGGSHSGLRQIFLNGFGTDGTTLAPGRYVAALLPLMAATASANYSLRGALVGALAGQLGSGTNAATTATSQLSTCGPYWGGRWTANTGGLPASVALSNVQQWTSHHPWAFTLQST